MTFKIRKKDLALFAAWLFSALVIRTLFIWLSPRLTYLPMFLEPIFTSLIIATIQWLVLRNFIEDAKQWTIFTFLGFSISTYLVDAFNGPLANLFSIFYNGTNSSIYIFLGLFQAVQGLFVGFFQWFALKWISPRAKWWIVFSALSNAISGTANVFYLNTLTAASAGGQITDGQDILRNLFTSGLNATLLGLGLIWILHKTIGQDELEDALEEFDFDDPEGDI